MEAANVYGRNMRIRYIAANKKNGVLDTSLGTPPLGIQERRKVEFWKII